MKLDTIKKADVRPVKARLLKIAKELDAGKHGEDCGVYAAFLNKERQQLGEAGFTFSSFSRTGNGDYHSIVDEPIEMQVLFVLMARKALTDVYDVVPD